MTDVNFLYSQAELSFAAYASLNSGDTNQNPQITALKDADFSTKQAEEFATRYTEVITQFNDTDTSFSATVFKDKDNNLTLAIKGTSERGDFYPTDLNIGLYGAGYDQILAMKNWWLRASTPAGQSVQQFAIQHYSQLTGQVPEDAVFRYTKTGKRRLIEYFLAPLLRYKQESARER